MALAPALASGATDLGPANTVYIKAGGGGPEGGLRFEAPKTIVAGEELEVLNQTNPHQVGPHTFSLVTKGSIPKTGKAVKSCFTPKHICMAIAKWHGTNGNGPVTKNPVKAGPRRLGHARQRDQDGRLLVHRRKEAGHLDRAAGFGSGRDDDLLHVRDPPVHARVDRSGGSEPLR